MSMTLLTSLLTRSKTLSRFIPNRTKHVTSSAVNSFGKKQLVRSFCQCGRILHKYTLKETAFNGIHMTIDQEYKDGEQFESDLRELLENWKGSRRKSVFLQVPISQSHLITVAAKYGFTFHHARDEHSVLQLWMVEGTASRLPQYANHTVGAAGACFNEEKQEVLLVQDRGRFSKWWKFPGGFSEKGEFVGETAVRETFEETGIESRFGSILSIHERHHETEFKQSVFYFLCRLHPTTYQINPCPHEIRNSRWFNIHNVADVPDCAPYVGFICKKLSKGYNDGYSNVDIFQEEMTSWVYPDRKFNLYHRIIDNDDK